MSKIKLNAPTGGGSVSLEAPSSTASNANVELKLPVADGSAGQFMKTDGSGNLSFGAAGGGKILQHQYVNNGDHLSTGAQSSYPELSSALRLTITPNASNSIIVIKYLLSLGIGSNAVATLRICKDVSNYSDAADSEMVNPPNTLSADTDGSGSSYGSYSNGWMHQALFMSIETAGNTTQRVYSIHGRVTSGTLHVNRWHSASYYRRSYAEIYEVAA